MDIEVKIRKATASDIDGVMRVEESAAEALVGFGLTSEQLPPQPRELYEQALNAGRLWVAESANNVVGMAVCSVIDVGAHLEEIDVERTFQGAGVGSKLLEAVVVEAQAAGFSQISLTTFRDVPFNAPWYQKHGFEEIAESDLSPDLAACRSHERELGLDVLPRCAMRRLL